MMTADEWTACSALLADALKNGRPADALLGDFFRQSGRRQAQHTRQAVADNLFAVWRHFEKISAVLPDAVRQPRLCALAAEFFAGRISTADGQTAYTAKEAALLRECAQRDFSGSLNTAAELPFWLIEKLRTYLDDTEILALGRCLNMPAPLDVRANTLKTARDTVLAQWQREGIGAAATPFSPWGIRIAGKADIRKHPLFTAGAVEIQDEGSQLLAWASGAKRGGTVVDFCAGAGGKTLAMGAMMRASGQLYAFDTSAARLAKLKPRVVRAGIADMVRTRVLDGENDPYLARLAGKCDTVLVDAPCSGSGTLRRAPDLKYRQTPQSIAQLVAVQSAVLRAAARLVRPGGRLVYATCSLLPEENYLQIQTFIQENPEFSPAAVPAYLPAAINGTITLLPHIHATDGFFAAILQREKT